MFFIVITDPPKEDRTFCRETSYSLALGDNQTICCPVSGYPPPFITWSKNGARVNNENSVLKIYSLMDKDYGNYTCTATDFRTSIGPINITIIKKGKLSLETDVNDVPTTQHTCWLMRYFAQKTVRVPSSANKCILCKQLNKKTVTVYSPWASAWCAVNFIQIDTNKVQIDRHTCFFPQTFNTTKASPPVVQETVHLKHLLPGTQYLDASKLK